MAAVRGRNLLPFLICGMLLLSACVGGDAPSAMQGYDVVERDVEPGRFIAGAGCTEFVKGRKRTTEKFVLLVPSLQGTRHFDCTGVPWSALKGAMGAYGAALATSPLHQSATVMNFEDWINGIWPVDPPYAPPGYRWVYGATTALCGSVDPNAGGYGFSEAALGYDEWGQLCMFWRELVLEEDPNWLYYNEYGEPIAPPNPEGGGGGGGGGSGNSGSSLTFTIDSIIASLGDSVANLPFDIEGVECPDRPGARILCLDFVIVADRYGPIIGDGRQLDINATPSASRVQVVVNLDSANVSGYKPWTHVSKSCMVAKNICLENINAPPHNVITMNCAGTTCVFNYHFTNAFSAQTSRALDLIPIWQPQAGSAAINRYGPAITGQLNVTNINGQPGIGSWNHSIFPSVGIYYIPNGLAGAGKQIIAEHKETAAMDLIKGKVTNHYTVPPRPTSWPNP